MNHFSKIFTALCFMALVFSSCKKDDKIDEPTPSYSIPSTYNFSNVSYADQTTLIAMQTELETEMNKGKTSVVDATVLKDMYANLNSRFTNTFLNSSTLNLKDHTVQAAQAEIEKFLDSIATASESTVAGSRGVAGVAVSTADANKKYLLNAKGFEYSQLVSKTLMGALWYHQIASKLSDASIGNSVDNTTVVPGQGTAMEHHWDEAFGYFGVPVDFPTNKTGLKYLGNYSNQVNAALNTNATFMNAFLKGRAAISNKDMATKDAQRTIIINELEKLIAASAIHEMNSAKNSLTDEAVRNHVISEAYAFVLTLKYVNPSRITNEQIDTILGYFGTNLYDISTQNIDNVINDLSNIYGFNSIKSTI